MDPRLNVTSTFTPSWQDWSAMATRMTSARFVGRAAELAELQAALRDAAERRPSLALVGGESGVGKSRLADELKRHARESGARVLSGDCVELGDDELPYAPLLSALRPLVREGDPALDALAPPLRAALDDILPGLGRPARRATPRSRASSRRSCPCSSRWARTSRSCSSSRTCTGPTARRARSSASSRARSAPSGCSCSAPTARTSCTAATRCGRCSPSWRATRTRACSSCRASRPSELAEQLEGILAGRPDAGARRAALLAQRGQRAVRRGDPRRRARRARLAAADAARRPDAARGAALAAPQELLRWIACQPSADHELVEAVAGLEPAELRAALREAVASQIVVTVGDDSYAFRHALLREVVYDDLLPGERTELHSALARALEERIERGEGGAHITAQAAHHWAAAGDQPQALRGRRARGARGRARERLRRGAGALRARARAVGPRGRPRAARRVRRGGAAAARRRGGRPGR